MNRETARVWLGQVVSALEAWARHPSSCGRQRTEFNSRARKFGEMYSDIAQLESPLFTTPYWREINDELVRRFVPRPPIDFLRDNLIAGTMFVDSRGPLLAEELSYLEGRIEHPRLRDLLREDYVGRPPPVRAYRTSHNTVHHLYHLERYREATSLDLAGFDTVVEWGGGYGNFAKLFRRTASSGGTYVIVDTPLFSALQWLYLSTVLGDESVHLVTPSGQQLERRLVNLVPIGLVGVLESARADLFVSTWALSETTADAQDHVLSRNWFGAPHLLLAYQESSNAFEAAARVGEFARARGASIHHLALLPGNYYAFA